MYFFQTIYSLVSWSMKLCLLEISSKNCEAKHPQRPGSSRCIVNLVRASVDGKPQWVSNMIFYLHPFSGKKISNFDVCVLQMGGCLHFTYHISIRNNEVNSLISGNNVWICFSTTSLFDFHPSNFNLPTNTLICRYRPPMKAIRIGAYGRESLSISIVHLPTLLGCGFQKLVFLPLLVPGEMIQFDYCFWNGLVQPPTRLASVYGMCIFVLTININRSSHRWYGKGTLFSVEDFNLQAASLMADVKVIGVLLFHV